MSLDSEEISWKIDPSVEQELIERELKRWDNRSNRVNPVTDYKSLVFLGECDLCYFVKKHY